jgi:hypothetical protein
LKETGIAPEDLVVFQSKSNVNRPAHFIAVDRAEAELKLVIRGTKTTRDIVTDLSGEKLPTFA